MARVSRHLLIIHAKFRHSPPTFNFSGEGGREGGGRHSGLEGGTFFSQNFSLLEKGSDAWRRLVDISLTSTLSFRALGLLSVFQGKGQGKGQAGTLAWREALFSATIFSLQARFPRLVDCSSMLRGAYSFVLRPRPKIGCGQGSGLDFWRRSNDSGSFSGRGELLHSLSHTSSAVG